MGLSGRKDKQRIPTDPRNLSWADDAAKFGQNYLSKLGWDPSKGLGVEGDGRTSHIKVSHKLDMLGIGAAHQKDPNGIAWKQNKDFENLLRRLNESSQAEGGNVDKVGVNDGDGSEKEDNKRKRKVEEEAHDGDEKAKKKRKKSKDGSDESDKKAMKSKKSKGDSTRSGSEAIDEEVVEPAKPYIPRHRAHRARVIASKSLASKSASAIQEILGIAPSPLSSLTPSTSGTPLGTLTPLNDDHNLERLTTSTKSVAEYFKERLLSKSAGSVPRVEQETLQKEEEPSSYDAPRGGLGSSRIRPDEPILDEVTQKLGMSKFSSLLSSSFLAATSSSTFTSTESGVIEEPKKKKNDLSEVGDYAKRKEKSEKKNKKKSRKGEGSAIANLEADSAKKERRKPKVQIDDSASSVSVQEKKSSNREGKEERKREKAERKAEKERRRQRKAERSVNEL